MINSMPGHASLVIAAALAGHASAAVIYVDDSAQGANDGTSWVDALNDLKDALIIAEVGDEVRIAQGTYKPSAPGHRDATFNLQTGVTVQGGYAGLGSPDPDALDPAIYVTILSGDLIGDDGPNFANYSDNSYHVLTADGVDGTAVLRGVTIRSGSADWPIYEWPPDLRGFGGALIGLNGGSPTLENCIIAANRAWFGGGAIYGESITLINCQLAGNKAVDFAPGGAIYADLINAVDCTFFGNGAENAGGACYGSGVLERCRFISNGSIEAGGAVAGSDYRVIGCDFISNSSVHWGGAYDGFDSIFVNCRFLKNVAGMNGGALRGGDLLAINCLLSGNAASYGGTAVSSCYPGSGCGAAHEFINCTFVGNGGPHSDGPAAFVGSSSVVSNCIFWNNNGSDQAQQVGGSMNLNHCIIQGWDGSLGGVGNSGDDPLMIDPDGLDDIYGTEDDDLRLADNSPCRDAGANDFLPDDELDLDDDGNTAEKLPLDFDSLRRVVNNIVDIGAFEWQTACPTDMAPSSPGQAGDGSISVLDLLAIMGAWGACDMCAADVTADGLVNGDDLLAVINGWGACR